MLLILTLIPLAMGLLVVIMALLKKMRPQTVAEKAGAEDRPLTAGNPTSFGARHGTDRFKEKEKKEVLR